MSEVVEKIHNFDLASFKKAQTTMIATSDNAYSSRATNQWRSRIKNYTEEEVKKIIESGSISE